MERKANNRKLAIVVIAIILCVLIVAVVSGKTGIAANSPKTDIVGSFSAYIDIIQEYTELKQNINSKTPYPELLKLTKSIQISDTPTKEAVLEAENVYDRMQAFLWYAQQNNLLPDKNQVEKYIEDTIQEAENTEEWNAISEACSNKGISLSELMYDDFDTYVYNQAVTNVYNDELSKWPSEDGFEDHWNELSDNIISSYKASKEYAWIKEAVEESKAIIISGIELSAAEVEGNKKLLRTEGMNHE